MCGNIQFRRGMCSCLLEERVSICGHLNLPFGLSWHSLDTETTEILCKPQARFAEKGESIHYSMTTISRLENTLSEHFYRILIFTALIKEDVEDLNEGAIETQDPTGRGTLTDMAVS